MSQMILDFLWLSCGMRIAFTNVHKHWGLSV